MSRTIYLNADQFQLGLQALDKELGKSEMVAAFAPIKLITAGGFLAINFLKSRDTTGDLDYLLEPEWANDKDIETPLKEAILQVADNLKYNDDWANEDMKLFVRGAAREELFRKAEEQNIVLFDGKNITLLAAPIEWAVERKIRRIFAADRGRKAELDMADALAMLKFLRDQKGGPLDRDYIRSLNINTFDVEPDDATMDRIAAAYREKYNEDAFA